jgi:hypothetical protein
MQYAWRKQEIYTEFSMEISRGETILETCALLGIMEK